MPGSLQCGQLSPRTPFVAQLRWVRGCSAHGQNAAADHETDTEPHGHTDEEPDRCANSRPYGHADGGADEGSHHTPDLTAHCVADTGMRDARSVRAARCPALPCRALLLSVAVAGCRF